MTIARRQQQQRSLLLPYFAMQRKRSTFPKLAALFCFFLVPFGYFSLRHYSLSNATTYRRKDYSKSKGADLFHSPDDIPIDLVHSLDAILVLGGGRPKSIDHPPVFVERRCDDAIEVVRRRVTNGNLGGVKGSNRARQNFNQYLPILCLSAGTAHLPQLLSADGLPIWESTACAAYILSKSNHIKNGNGNSMATETTVIPKEMIFVETSSYDTIGNAYFARTSHTEFNGWRKLLVVTNEFHMSRTMKIFDWIFSVPTDADGNQIPRYELYYLESPNAGMISEVVAARKEREASSAKSVDNLSQKFGTLRDVYGFLTKEHSLYAANLLVDRGHATAAEVVEDSIKDAVKRSYGAS